MKYISIIVKDINEPATEVYIEMIRENLFSIPITENGKLKGVLDLKELMNNLIKQNIK
jgi:signal-transduction protein with cAMP-binding, CBS, and nucleotidyltransferase domain